MARKGHYVMTPAGCRISDSIIRESDSRDLMETFMGENSAINISGDIVFYRWVCLGSCF